jgi:hypothetical protein
VEHTDNPIHAFKQHTTILLLPQLDPRINLNPPRELPQSILKALDLRRPHIGEASGSMPVQRGQGDIVKVYQPDLRNTTDKIEQKMEGRVRNPRTKFFWGELDVRSGKHDGSPTAHSSTSNNSHARSPNLFHTLLTKERIIPRELLSNQILIIRGRTLIPIPLPASVPHSTIQINLFRTRGRRPSPPPPTTSGITSFRRGRSGDGVQDLSVQFVPFLLARIAVVRRDRGSGES